MVKNPSRVLFPITCLLGGLLALGIYLLGLPGDFIFDDLGSIVANSSIHMADLGADSLLQAMTSSPTGGLQRPLSMLSFALDAYFFGISPFAFKLTNILIHLCVGALLGFVTRELLRAHARTTSRGLPPPAIAWLSLATALLWLVHPLNLTAVLYTVQRETALAALFTAAALLCYLIGRRRQMDSGGGRWHIWLWTPLFTALGMLCKENAALLPLYVAAVEWTLLRFRGAGDRTSRGAQGFLIVFLGLPALGAGILLATGGGAAYLSYAGRDFTLYERLLTECRVLLDYLRWTFVPDIRQLALFHDDIAPSRGLLDPVSTLPCAAAILLLLSGALVLRKRLPLLSLGILWFFAGHVLESTVLPLELAFEHRNYLPMFGIVFGVTSTAYLAMGAQGYQRLAEAFAVVVLVLFAGTTAARAAEWRTELSYARAEAAHHPHSPRALSELSWAYITYIVASKDRSIVPLAVRAAQQSKAADPHSINQNIGLAYMYSGLGDLDQEKAQMDAAAAAASTSPANASTLAALDSLLVFATPANQRLYPDMEDTFRAATQNPAMARNGCALGSVWNTYGLFSEQTGKFLDAFSMMHRAVSLCPGNPQIHANFAQMLLRYGDTRDAKAQIDALRSFHSLHYRPVLQSLEQEWTRQTGQHIWP